MGCWQRRPARRAAAIDQTHPLTWAGVRMMEAGAGLERGAAAKERFRACSRKCGWRGCQTCSRWQHSLHLVGCLQDHTDLSTQGTGWQDLWVRPTLAERGRVGGRGCSGAGGGPGFRSFTWWCIISLKTPCLLHS